LIFHTQTLSLTQSISLSLFFLSFLYFCGASLFSNCLSVVSTGTNNLISTTQTNESESIHTDNSQPIFKSLVSRTSTSNTTDLISKDHINLQRTFSSQNQQSPSTQSVDSAFSTPSKTSKLPIELSYLDPQHTEVFTVYFGYQLKIPYNFVLWSGDILSLCKYVLLSSSSS
jgi:hypothetical protein